MDVVAIYMMTHGAAQQSGRQMGTTAAPDLPSLSPPRSLSFRELAADCGRAFPSYRDLCCVVSSTTGPASVPDALMMGASIGLDLDAENMSPPGG